MKDYNKNSKIRKKLGPKIQLKQIMPFRTKKKMIRMFLGPSLINRRANCKKETIFPETMKMLEKFLISSRVSLILFKNLCGVKNKGFLFINFNLAI